MTSDVAATRARVAGSVVGREREVDLLLAAVSAGRDLILEGPPGTSKTTLLRAITQEWGVPLVVVEGSPELTPAVLVGHPARVPPDPGGVEDDVPGPLVQAMREGGFLYVEDLDRAPADTLDVLLTAIADRTLSLPKLGAVRAAPTFRLVASRNPSDDVGTTRLSTSVLDRLCRLTIDYQDDTDERDVVALRTGGRDGPLRAQLVDDAVAVTRATREHLEVRQGSSIRGAIDTVLVALQLTAMRGVASTAGSGYPQAVWDAMTVALSGRIVLDEAAETTSEQVLREIWEDRFPLAPAAAEPA